MLSINRGDYSGSASQQKGAEKAEHTALVWITCLCVQETWGFPYAFFFSAVLSVWTHSHSHAGSGFYSITWEISESLLRGLSSLAGVLPCCCFKCCCSVKFAHFFKWRLSRAVICQPRWAGLLFPACGDRRAGACYRRTEGRDEPGTRHPGPGCAGTERPGALNREWTARSSLRIWIRSILLFWWLVPEREVWFQGEYFRLLSQES